MKTNKEYKNEALAALRGNWPQAVLTSFVVLVLSELIYAFAWGFERLSVSDFTDKGVWVAPLLSGVMLVAVLSYMFFLTLPVAV